MGRYCYVPGRACESKFYEAPAIIGRAVLAARALRLHFRALPEGVNLVLDRAQLLPGWVGTYALRNRATPGAPVRGMLCYRLDAEAGSATTRLGLCACVSSLTGGLTITSYDPLRQQLSGYYEVRALALRALARTATQAGPRGTLVLAGDFAALHVQGCR
ncbi:hypothetical protein [Hymenobacter volaticus]|uniref:Uncharacterized protein n=1 Tax=Hymenobacter volaticus TaxID=2932254 RepID=A0ABY4GFL7_9BACT|nr:hypothetical protein [Hymenobacter volaticus]UOQ69735.1 hypothetical protein MUN86_29940 [Hymenobacter volaticus]